MIKPSLVDLSTAGAEPDTPAARHLARIVAAATANPAGFVISSAVRCRRRPEHQACSGHIHVRRQHVPDEIRWACPRCGDGGVARHWRRSPWSLGLDAPDPRALDLLLPEPLYRVIESGDLPEPVRRLVLGATLEEDGVRVHGAPEALRGLQRHLHSIGRRARTEGLRRRADQAASLIADLGPPPSSSAPRG